MYDTLAWMNIPLVKLIKQPITWELFGICGNRFQDGHIEDRWGELDDIGYELGT